MSDESQSVIYGKNAVLEALKSGQPIDTVYLSEGMDPKTAGYFTALAKEAGAVVKRVRGQKLDTLCQTGHHQGVAAGGAVVEYLSLEELLQKAAEKGQPPFLVLADGIEDPYNLGALMRSALLCGAHGMVLPRRGASAVTPTVVKASAGAALLLPVARVANIGEAVRRLKKENLFAYCADAGGTPLSKTDLSGPVALVMGGEGKGVSPLVKKLCDGVVSLSMERVGEIDSFNVSVAGGILMYHIHALRNEG